MRRFRRKPAITLCNSLHSLRACRTSQQILFGHRLGSPVNRLWETILTNFRSQKIGYPSDQTQNEIPVICKRVYRRIVRRPQFDCGPVRFCALTLGLLLIFSAETVWGQAADNSPMADKTASSSDAEAEPSGLENLDVQDPTVIYFIDETGKRLPLLIGRPGQSPEQVLKELQTTETTEPAPAPIPATVTRIGLEGSVSGERATLTAQFTIQVQAENAFVAVPLQLAEATIIGEAEHQGPGDSLPGKLSGSDGYRWWLRGKGEHRLTLKISVPVETRSPKSAMKLTLPPSAVSVLKLKVPHAEITATAQNKDSRAQPVISKIQDSEIAVLGLGRSFELSWQATGPTKMVQPVLEVDNTMAVDFDVESIFVKVQQKLQVIQGTGLIETVRVDLPTDSKLKSLHGPDVIAHSFDPDEPHTVVIQLSKPTIGPVELNWNVEWEAPDEATAIVLEGFRVQGAVRESGRIGLSVAADRRIDVDTKASKFVRRTDTTSADQFFDTPPNAVYRISKQPFQLVTKVRHVQPRLTVTPQILLTCSSSGIEMQGTFRFRVTGGEVETVHIDWPNWRQNGWTLQPFEPRAPLTDRFENGARISFRLARRTGSTFTVRLRAHRPILQEDESLDFDLPAAEASRRLPATVIVAAHDNVQMDFQPEGETTATLLGAPMQETLQLPETVRDLRRVVYEVDGIPRRFTGQLTTHKKSVQTSAIVQLITTTSPLSVRQTISYTVAWGRESVITLLTPEALLGRVRYFLDDDIELAPTRSPAPPESGFRRITLTLDSPRSRRFNIVAVYDLDEEFFAPKQNDESLLNIPVIRPVDNDYTTTTFEAVSSGGRQVRFDEADWRPQMDRYNTPTWSVSRSVETIPVTILQNNDAAEKSDILITRALARTRADITGDTSTEIYYQLRELPETLEMEMPAGQTLLGVSLNGATLSPEIVEDSAAESPEVFRYSLEDFSQTTPTTTLRISYRSSSSSKSALSHLLQIPVPKIAGETWVGESVWEVILPPDHILFADPVGFSSQNRWLRAGWGGLLYSRVPQQTSQELAAWIAAPAAENSNLTDAGKNRYQFARLAPLENLSARTMSWPMIVGFGSGLSLILGLMFQYVAASRNTLTLLAIGFVLAVAGIWYATPVILLMQASVLGVILAGSSASVQMYIRRRRSGVISLAPGSGYSTVGGSSFEHDVTGVSDGRVISSIPPTEPSPPPGSSSPSTVTGATK